MRIGIMLRSLDEKFGIGIYTRYMLEALLRLDRDHQYVLFYRSETHLGKYAHYPNVEEKVVWAPHKILWDQVAIPLAARAANIEVIYHPKFTVPLFTRAKTVMVLHGSNWFFHPEFYSKVDIWYVKFAMPRYCKSAAAIIPNSNLTRDDFVKVLGVPREKMVTITPGLRPIFRQIQNPETLQETKLKYALPDRFVLTVGRYTPRKNFETTLKALQKSGHIEQLKLVGVGDFQGYPALDRQIAELGLQEKVVFPGYVEHQDLPAIYNLAEVFIFPSIYEELGLPLIEAMACGCPIVASNIGAIPEVTGGLAILADPFDADSMAAGIDRLLEDKEFRQQLIDQGVQRVQRFSYDEAARRTLAVLEKVAEEVN